MRYQSEQDSLFSDRLLGHAPGSRMIRTPHDAGYLRDLFGRNARTYDPVNSLISLGQVACWRADLVRLMGIAPGHRVLDAFSGPGSLSLLAIRRLGSNGHLVLADVSPVMLAEALRRVRPVLRRPAGRRGRPQIGFRVADLTQQVRGDSRAPNGGNIPANLVLGAGSGGFHRVLVGFGLRYVPDVVAALATLRSLTRPGGRLGILEFTVPENHGLARAVWALPHAYFARVLPALAGHLSGDREVYDYLRASSEGFLTPRALLEHTRAAGLRPLICTTRMGGLVTLIVATPEQ
jgi:demethylmenaquinone methyltransferase/2-methoxy-6-polyprenyl-1,4-benzoquinol methylase